MNALEHLAASLPLAADMPKVDALYGLNLTSRALHILGAMILGGGVFYLRAVAAPAGNEAAFAGRRGVWARWVAIATILLTLTGMYNYIRIVQPSKLAGATPLPFAYHMLFGLKFLLAIFVMFVAAIVAGRTALADKFRGNLIRWLNLAWMAVTLIVVIAAVMRTLH